MRTLSRFSYLLLSLVLVAAAIAATIWLQWGIAGEIGTLVLIAVLAIYWVAARRGGVTPADPEKKLRRAREGGRAVVLQFYSDFHLGCLLRRPFSAKLERAYRGRFEFIYVSVFHPQAAGLMESLKAGLGDWVFFDAAGRLVGQASRLTEAQLRRTLEAAPQP